MSCAFRRLAAAIDRADERKLTRIIVFAAFALCCVRLVNLDADLPNMGVGFAAAIDEGMYSKQALNFYEYGSWTTSGEYPFDTGDSYKAIVIGNLLQIVSMQIFGDTYFAFRLPYVLMGLAAILLMLVLTVRFLATFCHDGSTRLGILIGVCVLFIFDFPLQICTRVVESSSIRMLGNIVMLLVLLGFEEHPRLRNFLLGLIAICGVFFIYFSNVTGLLVLLMYGIWLLVKRDWAHVRTCALWSALGILVGLALAETYYLVAWNQGAFETLYEGVSAFSTRLKAADGESALSFYLENGAKFWLSNMFFYNPFLLGVTLVSLPVNIWYALKRESREHFAVCAFIMAVFFQAFLANDWMQRKAIVAYPAVILNAVLFLSQLQEIWLPAWRAKARSQRILLCLGAAAAYLVLVYGMFRYRKSNSFLVDYSDFELCIVVAFTAAESLLFLLLLAYACFKLERPETPSNYRFCGTFSLWTGLLCGVVLSVSCSAVFDYEYIYGTPTYTEKATMIAIGEYLGESYVADPLCYAYLLYNDIKPICNDDEVVAELFQDEDINYMIDYAEFPYCAYEFVESEDDLTLVATFYRAQEQYGSHRDIGIFIKTELVE